MENQNLGCLINGHQWKGPEYAWFHYYHHCSECKTKMKCLFEEGKFSTRDDCEGCNVWRQLPFKFI